MSVSMRIILILILLITLHSVRSEGDDASGEEEASLPVEAKGKKVVDRLATNLASAFVKSLFPQVKKSKKKEEKDEEKEPEAESQPEPREYRRAPMAYQGSPVSPSMGQYGGGGMQPMQSYDGLPHEETIDPRDPMSFQTQRRPMYIGPRQHLPAQYVYNPQTAMASRQIPAYMMNEMRRAPMRTEAMRDLMGFEEDTPNAMQAALPMRAAMLASPPSGMEGVNVVRNQQYMAELAKHQAEVSEYGQKQMQYLDQQRRYQQAMIDHQAGAALLIQQQQQALLEEQMNKAKQMQESPLNMFGGGEDARTPPPLPNASDPSSRGEGSDPRLGEDNTGGKVLMEDNNGVDVRRKSAGFKRTFTEDDMVVTDERLRQYFKEQYNIDIPEDGTALTDDERETLRMLRNELTKRKDDAIKEGTFRTMSKLKEKVLEKPEDSVSSMEEAPPLDLLTEDVSVPPRPPTPFLKSSSQKRKSFKCPRCLTVKLKEIQGTWTQIFGNPAAMKKTFSTIISLEDLNVGGDTEGQTLQMSSRKPSCVGMEISKSKKDTGNLNIFFKDDSPSRKLHEMRGEIFRQGDDSLLLSTDMYNSQVCIVKAGPAESDRYEFIVMAETTGQKPCAALHVFARNTDEFELRNYDDFSEFMKTKAEAGSILPIAKLPESKNCQLE